MGKIKVDQVRELKIAKTGNKGDGIAFVEGFAIIVPDTTPGEVVKAKITKVLERCAFAKVVEG